MAVKGLARRKNVQEILRERKLLGEEQLKQAEAQAQKANITLQQALIELKLMEKPRLLKALSEDWQVKAVDLTQMDIDKEIASIIPETVARRHIAIPFAKEESVLFIAMADPKDFFVVEDIQLRTGLEIQAYLAMPWDILAALDTVYGRGDSQVLGKLIDQVQKKQDGLPPEGGMQIVKDAPKTDISEMDASAPEVEKWMNAILLGCITTKASDIHIEPFEDPTGKNSRVLLRYRVDGMLRKGPFDIPWAYRNAIAAKLKIMASLNITERRIPQSGRIQILAGGSPVEFRVEVVPTCYGESAVMRLLDRRSIQVDINTMGFLPDTLKTFLGLLHGIGGKKNFGLVLVCGPTGSGKSTTLYGALNYINRPDIKILTAENPVEYNLDGIVQVPVNPDLKLGENKCFNFAAALRSFLRLDPDVIMVGEIRDEETAHIAMEAAMTGHLVFSTIHTNNAPASISRIVDMGLPGYMVAATMKAILAQRLGRRICGDCKQDVDITPEELKVFQEYKVEPPANGKIKKGPGCDTCKGTGYKGRCGFHELLVLTEPIRKQCLSDVSETTLMALAVKEGMRTIIMDGLEKVKMGMTSVREVLGGAEEEPKK
ncbi:MAG: Flp pilus assembly complex ATPase component TadA [Elusimicrobia bacterium]|nr:Flp pilus assembly complex ATPase component TadA [Elusimicrobiota bacterium]